MMFSVLLLLMWFSSLLLSIRRDIRMRLPVKSHLFLSLLFSLDSLHSHHLFWFFETTFLLLDRHYCDGILWWNVSNKTRKRKMMQQTLLFGFKRDGCHLMFCSTYTHFPSLKECTCFLASSRSFRNLILCTVTWESGWGREGRVSTSWRDESLCYPQSHCLLYCE